MNEISKEIRRVRLERGITLKELSDATGLSVSFLSQVERGESNMTITSLKKIADALGVSMKNLFPDEEDTVFLRTKNDQRSVNLGKKNILHKKLSGLFEGRKLEAVIAEYKPNTIDTENMSHDGEEFVYVLKGEAVVMVDNKKYIVKEEESIHYPSTLPHSLSNYTSSEVKVLVVLTQILT